jgi:rubrerythrin
MRIASGTRAWPGRHSYDPVIDFLIIARVTEFDSAKYFRHLQMTPLRRNVQLKQFLPEWLNDEQRHGQIIETMLLDDFGVDESVLRQAETARPFIASLTPAFFAATWIAPTIMCPLMLSGLVVNELVAFLAYARVAQLTDNASLKTRLGRIAGEERQHAERFASIARPLLTSPKIMAITQVYFEHFWRPVGSFVTKPEVLRELSQALFNVHTATDRVPELDRRASKMLGIDVQPSAGGARRLARIDGTKPADARKAQEWWE